MRLPFGTDPMKYKWQRISGRVFCMDDDGQIVFVIDEPANWREAMLRAFEAGRLSEIDSTANYVELLETLCEEMLPDAFTPLDTAGIDVLVKAKLMELDREAIQKIWNDLERKKALEWDAEKKAMQLAVDKSWEDFEEIEEG